MGSLASALKQSALNMLLRILLLAAFALSCACGSSPCQTPVCCESGEYTKDECGCCLTCAKAEGQRCGGPFRIAGSCSDNLRCLRQCECKTVSEADCIFPFNYKGVSYSTCTTEESENKVPWCATQVDETGEVVKNSWQDCSEGCPGTGFECNEGFLFNVEGTCVNGTEATSLLASLRAGPLAVVLDDIPSETNQKVAPLCPRGRGAEDKMKKCHCEGGAVTKGLDGNSKGGCIQPLIDPGFEEASEGWCFLSNVQNPVEPTEDCFEDTLWSVSDGKFWSNEACFVEKAKSSECLTSLGSKCIFPFEYEGQTYNQCTTQGSENAQAWCATKVDSSGVVVRNSWEDCHHSCPGTGEVLT